MNIVYNKDKIKSLENLLKKKKIWISESEIKNKLDKIIKSQKIFSLEQQRALFIKLLCVYESKKQKQVIILEELSNQEHSVTLVLGVLAEDWPGMSNSIIGIIHHEAQNILFIKGITVEYETKRIGIVILAFNITSNKEYERFIEKKRKLIATIREASIGTENKFLLLKDENVKFEIYNKIVTKINRLYKDKDISKLTGENGEALKFVSSRSREYLEERKLKDLANLVIDNYKFQEKIKNSLADEVIRIKNIETKHEKLTGITFVCKKILISIEDFLKTLNYIIPEYIIKHHKSFVTKDNILLYRIEIVDRNGEALESSVTKSIEKSLKKLIETSYKKQFTQIKSVGGFEHYARAIIPFLMLELKKTNITQVFINANKKTDFSIDIKLTIVSRRTKKKKTYNLIAKLEKFPGIEVNSAIPPKIYANHVVIDMLKLNVHLSEFTSIKEVFSNINDILKKVYGKIRDFDQCFREIDIKILNELLEKTDYINPVLVRDIFFNFDELYRIEISFDLLYEVIKFCSEVIEKSNEKRDIEVLYKYKNLKHLGRTIFVISYIRQKHLLGKIIKKLKDFDIYFTKVDRDQRTYYIMIICKDNKIIEESVIKEIKDYIRFIYKKKGI